MILSVDTLKSIENDLEVELEDKMHSYPIRVYIDGIDTDIDTLDISGGEINIFINDIYSTENGKEYELNEIKGA